MADIDWQLAMPHETREYCVQYNETCYDFLKRIWAEEGMFFWFEHSASTHKMIVSDAPLAMPMLKAAQSIAYNNLPGGAKKGFWVSRFNQKERLRATRRVSKDYTFKQPSAPHLYEVGQYMPNGAKGEYELYTYPGRHKTPGTGQPFNDYALEAHRVEATTAEGETNNIQLSSGFIFALFDHPDETLNSNHRLLRVTHKGKQPSALEEEAPEDEATTYTAYFISQPARIPYRPINPNPKPMVEGPQIAVVTGPKGEEIYCDEHGRIKVWFPWDRHGKKDEKSSCWVRVSQSWAGGNWGTMAVPRIGQEVICDFLSGDPDQPIITGRTYHAMNKPPYPLPDHKTRMTIKSQTHKGEGYNEITFEDEAEKEFVYIHAQKDMELHVKNSYQKRVEFDSTESIGNNSHLAVAKDRIEKVDGNQDMTVVGNLTEKVEGDHNLTIEGVLQAKSAGDFTFKSDGNTIFDASQITLVSGSTALVVSSSGVDIAPVLNVGSASAVAAGTPPAPVVLTPLQVLFLPYAKLEGSFDLAVRISFTTGGISASVEVKGSLEGQYGGYKFNVKNSKEVKNNTGGKLDSENDAPGLIGMIGQVIGTQSKKI